MSDIDSIERLKAVITKPAFNRIQTLSNSDFRRRLRGSWAYSLTITASASVPLSLLRANVFHLDRALISLFRMLPNLRQLATSGAFTPSFNMLQHLPKSLNQISFGRLGSECSRVLPSCIRQRISVLELTTSDSLSQGSIDFPGLQWLSITPNTFANNIWPGIDVAFLRLSVESNEESFNIGPTLEVLGPRIRRMEIHNSTSTLVTIDTSFLQLCPQLEALLIDAHGFRFNTVSVTTSPSIKSLTLISKERDSGEHGLSSLWSAEDVSLRGLSNLIEPLLKLMSITLSFPITAGKAGYYSAKLVEIELKRLAHVPIVIVFY